MKGRKKTPTILKMASGNPGKRKLPKAEPSIPGSLPPAPNWLTKEAKAIYQRDAALFTWLDTGQAEGYAHRCAVVDRLHAMNRQLNKVKRGELHHEKDLLLRIRDNEIQLLKFEATLGIPMTERTKLTAPGKKAGDELDAYAKTKDA